MPKTCDHGNVIDPPGRNCLHCMAASQRSVLPGGGIILRCYVNDRTYAILAAVSDRTGRSIEDLAEAAIAEEALRSIPPQAR